MSNLRLFPRRADALRLFALGRIPRCKQCPRYAALSVSGEPRSPLPARPKQCKHEICAPMSRRFEAALERLRLRASGL
jgi:hypothetical protein